MVKDEFEMSCSDRGKLGSLEAKAKNRSLNFEERKALADIAKRGLGISQGKRGGSEFRQEKPDLEVCYLDVEAAVLPEVMPWECRFD